MSAAYAVSDPLETGGIQPSRHKMVQTGLRQLTKARRVVRKQTGARTRTTYHVEPCRRSQEKPTLPSRRYCRWWVWTRIEIGDGELCRCTAAGDLLFLAS